MVPALLTYGVLMAWLVVPGTIAFLALRSTTVRAGMAWAGMGETCPDCGADPGEPCHWDCSSNWTDDGVSQYGVPHGNTTVRGWRE